MYVVVLVELGLHKRLHCSSSVLILILMLQLSGVLCTPRYLHTEQQAGLSITAYLNLVTTFRRRVVAK